MKLLSVIVAALIASLKLALMTLLLATPVTGGVVASGDVAVTVGSAPAPGVPRIGSRPLPPHPATSATNSAGSNPRADSIQRLNKFIWSSPRSEWQFDWPGSSLYCGATNASVR